MSTYREERDVQLAHWLSRAFEPKDTGVKVYSISGRTVFELRASDGSVVSKRMVYLVHRPAGYGDPSNPNRFKAYVYGIEFEPEWDLDKCMQEVLKADHKFWQLLRDGKARQYDTDGGSLGRGDNVEKEKGK